MKRMLLACTASYLLLAGSCKNGTGHVAVIKDSVKMAATKNNCAICKSPSRSGILKSVTQKTTSDTLAPVQ